MNSATTNAESDCSAKLADSITLREAATYLKKSPATIARWIDAGYRGHVLQTIKCGHSRLTKRVWCDEMLERMQTKTKSAFHFETTTQKNKRIARLDREADEVFTRFGINP